jgi:hypothetical protein
MACRLHRSAPAWAGEAFWPRISTSLTFGRNSSQFKQLRIIELEISHAHDGSFYVAGRAGR